MSKFNSTLTGALTAALAISLVATAPADARRGGSFGSRGYRTYSAPRPTSTAPGYTAPVQRSMTPGSPGATRNGYQPSGPSYMPGGGFGQRRPGFGMGLVGGLITGGLIGGLMGHGWGGGFGGGMGMGGGFLTILLQLLIFGLIASFVMRLFRRRNTPMMAGGFGQSFDAGPAPGPAAGPWGGAGFGGGGGGFGGGDTYPSPAEEIAVSFSDRKAFEQLLVEVQAAFGREDYAALRAHTTPEVMGYLAEELSDNATHGRKNDVSAVRLQQADVSEAWREGAMEYATMALRYESIDVMRDRQSGAVIKGDPDRPTTTTELWTFVRPTGGEWKLSAIQET